MPQRVLILCPPGTFPEESLALLRGVGNVEVVVRYHVPDPPHIVDFKNIAGAIVHHSFIPKDEKHDPIHEIRKHSERPMVIFLGDRERKEEFPVDRGYLFTSRKPQQAIGLMAHHLGNRQTS